MITVQLVYICILSVVSVSHSLYTYSLLYLWYYSGLYPLSYTTICIVQLCMLDYYDQCCISVQPMLYPMLLRHALISMLLSVLVCISNQVYICICIQYSCLHLSISSLLCLSISLTTILQITSSICLYSMYYSTTCYIQVYFYLLVHGYTVKISYPLSIVSVYISLSQYCTLVLSNLVLSDVTIVCLYTTVSLLSILSSIVWLCIYSTVQISVTQVDLCGSPWISVTQVISLSV